MLFLKLCEWNSKIIVKNCNNYINYEYIVVIW